jgi:hypothetical protein
MKWHTGAYHLSQAAPRSRADHMASFLCHVVGVTKRCRLERIVRPQLRMPSGLERTRDFEGPEVRAQRTPKPPALPPPKEQMA